MTCPLRNGVVPDGIKPTWARRDAHEESDFFWNICRELIPCALCRLLELALTLGLPLQRA